MMGVFKKIDFNSLKMTESEIIKRILNGEKELYEILLRRNNQKLYRVIRSYIKVNSEIEDVMQNTYLKAFEKLYQFKHTATYSTWLIRIGINEVLARLKEKGKIVHLQDMSFAIESNFVLEIPDSDQLNPEKKMIQREAKQLLENSIDVLEVKYRTVYILREIEGMSIKEISECMGISISNVKVRLHRAKGMLKENLYNASVQVEDIFEFGNSKCDDITNTVMRIIL